MYGVPCPVRNPLLPGSAVPLWQNHGHGTPCPYALTPHSYALTPTTSLLTPTPSLLTPHSYALTPHSYDLTPHSSPDNRPPLEVPPLVAEKHSLNLTWVMPA